VSAAPRWIAALLLALAAATPAQAQQMGVFPDTMLGRWCGEVKEFLFCMNNDRTANGEVIGRFTYSRDGGDEQIYPDTRFTVEQGRIVMASVSGETRFVEVPHPPGELVMANDIPANIKRGAAERIGYRLEGDTLVVTYNFANGTEQVQRYRRTAAEEK
jgi:hypothetical protein